MELMQCYNKGCGIKFDPCQNGDDVCMYHPGEPVFHDAYKSWSCCKKRSTDFTTFLNTQGCSRSQHNPIKPAEPAKYVPDPDDKDTVVEVGMQQTERKIRPSYDAPMTRIVPSVSQSLKQLIAKNEDNGDQSEEEKEVDPSTGIKIGEPCKRNGCRVVYEDVHSSMELCKYHSGGPMFHEGMKYWTCCNKKTSDFTEFLMQAGCTTDSHLWSDDKYEARKSNCRYDWHQTGSDVYVTIYAKAAVPARTTIHLSPVRLNAQIIYSGDLCFNLDVELTGLVSPSQSCVSLAATKVEIKLKKDEPLNWRQLHINKAVIAPFIENDNEEIDEPSADEEQVEFNIDDVDVDLSEL